MFVKLDRLILNFFDYRILFFYIIYIYIYLEYLNNYIRIYYTCYNININTLLDYILSKIQKNIKYI